MKVKLPRPKWRTLRSVVGTSLRSGLGMSRHSALSALRFVTPAQPTTFAVQAISLFIGSSLIGVAVALLFEAHLGLAPYDVLASGLSARIGISLGHASWAIAALLSAVATLLGHRPSLWGISYVLLNGLAIDAASGLLKHPDSLLVRMSFVPAGIVFMAVGISFVLHSGTTGGPFELLMAAGEERGIKRLHVRYALDVGVLVGGILLGGTFGPATVVYAALMGAAIMAVGQAFADHEHGRAMRSSYTSLAAGVVHPSQLAIQDGPESLGTRTARDRSTPATQ